MTALMGDFAADTMIHAQPAEASATQSQADKSGAASFPHPEDLRYYLRHVEGGESIRALAREAGCHASTILRRIRRIEQRRDDPLVDQAIERATASVKSGHDPASRRETEQFRRILRRLCESDALLLVSEGMDKAIVVRRDIRTAILDREIAEKMAMNGWVMLKATGRMRHYAITPTGRNVLKTTVPHAQIGGLPRRAAFCDAALVNQPDHATTAVSDVTLGTGDQHRIWEERDLDCPDEGKPIRVRVNLAESPVHLMARRRTAVGEPFLSQGMVAAAERLREDFELAQLGPRVTQNWDRFLTAGASAGINMRGFSGGSEGARNRVANALRELGPGMGDLCLRVCCFLEGIESTERRLGWSARSGKIVLKLALMRLEQHYLQAYGTGAPMIG